MRWKDKEAFTPKKTAIVQKLEDMVRVPKIARVLQVPIVSGRRAKCKFTPIKTLHNGVSRA